MKEKFEGYTGKIAEEEVLGKTTPEQKEDEVEFNGEYIPFEQAIDLVKDNQPFKDPTDPHEKKFPHDVHAMLADILSLENYEQLSYYTAVSSYLDERHGVDAFFELHLGNGDVVRATLDMTQNPRKHDYKADVIFHWPREGLDRHDEGDRVVWLDKVKEVAAELKNVLVSEAESGKGVTIRSLNEEEIKESKRLAENARQQRLLRAPQKVLQHHG